MATLSELRKQAKLAPKFVLAGDFNGQSVFIGDMRSLSDVHMVSNVDNATKFSVGYDDENMKLRAWNMTAKLAGLNVVFAVKYL